MKKYTFKAIGMILLNILCSFLFLIFTAYYTSIKTYMLFIIVAFIWNVYFFLRSIKKVYRLSKEVQKNKSEDILEHEVL